MESNQIDAKGKPLTIEDLTDAIEVIKNNFRNYKNLVNYGYIGPYNSSSRTWSRVMNWRIVGEVNNKSRAELIGRILDDYRMFGVNNEDINNEIKKLVDMYWG